MDDLNVEFVRLLHKSGMKAAQAAPQLGISPGAISQIVNGDTRPSKPVMLLLRQLASEASGGEGAPRLAPWERELLEKLRGLDPDARRQFIAGMSTMIGAVRPTIEGVSSEVAGVAVAGGASAVAKALRESQEPDSSPGVAGPSARKGPRGRGTGGR